jgi:hypothetical protein
MRTNDCSNEKAEKFMATTGGGMSCTTGKMNTITISQSKYIVVSITNKIAPLYVQNNQKTFTPSSHGNLMSL